MPIQLLAVLQFTGILAAFLGVYLGILEYLMPTPSHTLDISTDK